MNTKHTPGPWKFHEQGEANQFCLLTTNDNHWVIGLIQNGELWTDEQKANARLIAAAPELLETLKQAQTKLQFLANQQSTPLKISSAIYSILTGLNIYELIAKATGEKESNTGFPPGSINDDAARLAAHG